MLILYLTIIFKIYIIKVTLTQNSPLTDINDNLVNSKLLPCKEGLLKKKHLDGITIKMK